MIKIRINKTPKEWAALFVFYLLLLQNPLSKEVPFFTYVDEAISLVGPILILYYALRRQRIRIKHIDSNIILLMILFITIGLIGNIRYHYQPIEAVLTDLIANTKYFLAILSGYAMFSVLNTRKVNDALEKHIRLASALLFVLFCVDVVFHVFYSAERRYGMRTIQLFYSHATFLAGIEVFLLSFLMVFYKRKNIPYMIMSLIVLVSTLRGKAFAGAVTYVALFYFLIYTNKKINIFHIAVIAAIAITIAWEQIDLYFIRLSGESARSVLTTTSIDIMRDHFPIDTGFGTYASAAAVEYYSPVYYLYGLHTTWGLSEEFSSFGSDTFWPIIIGQTGFLGTVCFVGVLTLLFFRIKQLKQINSHFYAAALFSVAYLMISSMGESSFHNPVAVPLAVVLGYVFALQQSEPVKK